MKEVEPFLLTGSILFGAVTALGGVFVQGFGHSRSGDGRGASRLTLLRFTPFPALRGWLGALNRGLLAAKSSRPRNHLKRLGSIHLGRHQVAHIVDAGTDKFLVVFGNGGPPALARLDQDAEHLATPEKHGD